MAALYTTATTMLPFLEVVDHFLTADRCEGFIAHFRRGGGKELVQVDSGLAVYKRGVLVDATLAAEVFARVRHLVPPHLHVVSANDHFRFSEYGDGGEFKTHRDGINQDAAGRRSVATVNIFLNDGYGGGSTDFFHADRTLRRSVQPQTGRAAIFDSQQYHCGRPVSGTKFLLRTDLMA